MIIKGFILETSQGGQRAKVKISQGEILDNVLLLHPYGESNNMQSDESSQVLILFANNSKTNAFGIPYNVLLQPTLMLTEKAVGNFKIGNKITFKANGDIEIDGANDFLAQSLKNLNVTADTKITLNAPDISLGDAVGLVLNDTATMQVTIPSGSSAGTYNVAIIKAGQSKVNA